MKEGEVMNEKNEFDILENAESSVTDRLEAEFPPRDNREKEKIFRMSERKFNNTSAPDTEKEQTVSGVEVYRRPKWQRGLSIAAACALVVGGATGGAYAFNRFRNTPAAESQLDTQKKVAPFGDFSELEYKIKNIDMDNMKKVMMPADDKPDSFIPVWDGENISQQKRDKLADLFNNYDYESVEIDVTGYGGMTDEELAEMYDTLLEQQNAQEIPSFCLDSNNMVRDVFIHDIEDDEGSDTDLGGIIYTYFSYTEQDGQLVMPDEQISAKAYKIDYGLFKSTINEILSSEDEEETPTEPEYKGVAPFGNFSEHEYFIPGGEDAEKQIFVKADEETQITFGSGEVISTEQSKQIEELFNSLEWNESVEPKTKPFWLVGIDRMTFISMDGSDFNMLSLNGDNNTLTWDSFRYETESEYEGMANYKRTEGSARQIKTYDIDYISLVNKLSEIMGRDLGYSIHNSFLNSDWSTEDDRVLLSEEQKRAIYELLSSCDFDQASESPKQISPDANLVLSREENNGTHTLLNIESNPDSTIFGYVNYEVDENGQYNGSDNTVMWLGYCPDNTIEEKISEILGRSKNAPLPEIITDLTTNDWRFLDTNPLAENHLHYDVVDLNTKYTDGYDNSYLQMIYGTDSIPEDKLKLISDLLNSTAWYESDYTEQHDLLFPDDNYDATQCIELSMMDDDHIFVMTEQNTSMPPMIYVLK